MTGADDFKIAQRRLLQRFGVDAESHFLHVPAVSGKVHVLRQGEGPAVVMVPGFADPTAMWAPLMAQLDGFARYAVDRPCFGLTACAPHSTATFRGLAVDFLEQTLDRLQLERPLLIGNSIGSLWATWLAIDRPDRVAALVHVGCPAFILGTSAPLPLRLLSVRGLGRLIMAMSRPSERQVEAFTRTIGGEDISRLPELTALLLEAQRLPGARAAILRLLRTVVTLRGARPEVALTARQLAQVRQPVRLIWGSRDAFGAPRVGEEASRILPDAELHVVAEAGHVPWLGRSSDVTAAALPFMRRQHA